MKHLLAIVLAALTFAASPASASDVDRALPVIGKPIEGRLLANSFTLETQFGSFEFKRQQVWDIHVPEDPDRPFILRTRKGDRLSGFLAAEGFDFDVDGKGVRRLGRDDIHRIVLAGTADAEPFEGAGHRVTLLNGDRIHGQVMPQRAAVVGPDGQIPIDLSTVTQGAFGMRRDGNGGEPIAVLSRGNTPPIIVRHQIDQLAIRLHSGRELTISADLIAAVENLADGQSAQWEQTAFRDRLANGAPCPDCPQMRIIPAGTYAMGARESEEINRPYEGPVHTVSIAYPFAIGVFEVTFDQWDACHADGACRYRGADERFGRGSRPAISLNLGDAAEFLDWLTAKTGITYRLPSEAEWELAARAGTTTSYYWGDQLGRANAVCEKCRTKWDNKKTAPTGSFPPNPFGLYDILGNAWEWTADCWGDGYVGAPTDGSAWRDGDCRGHVMRGGAWFSFPENVRSATRFRSVVSNRYLSKGLRVVRDF